MYVRYGNYEIFSKKKNQQKELSICAIVGWLLYGAIALSGWSYYILCDVIKVPLYLYEVFFIPIIFKYHAIIISKVKKMRKIYIFSFAFLVFFLLIGFCVNPQHIFVQITTYRTLFYVWAFMYFFSGIKNFDIKRLQLLCVGSCVGQMLFIVLISKSEGDVTAVNIMALSLMIIIPIIKDKFFEAVFFCIVGLILSFVSAFRINIIIVLMAFRLSLLYMVINKSCL